MNAHADGCPIAEYKGPGGRRSNRFTDESPDEFDAEESNGVVRDAIRSGRIIMLGDGTEVLTDSDNTAMFDDEQKDEKDDEALAKTPSKEDKSVDTEMKDTQKAPAAEKAAEPATEAKKEGNTAAA